MLTTQPDADALVLFGATGDLAVRKLFPALYRLATVRRAAGAGDRRRPQRLDRRRLPPPRTRVDRRAHRRPRSRRHRLAVRAPRPRAGRLRRRGHLERTPSDPRPPQLAGRRVLHGDPAEHVPDGRHEARVGRPAPARPHRRREAVRPRPPVGDRVEQDPARGVLGGPHLPHRPLPRQGGRRGPARVPLRQHAARAGVESELRAQRAGDDVGDARRRGPRVVLRGRRRDPRRAAEPRVAGGVAAGDGAAGRGRLRVPAGREGQGDRGDAPDRTRRAGSRPVRRLPRRAGRRPELHGRDVRGRATGDRLVALGRRALVRPRRQGPAAERRPRRCSSCASRRGCCSTSRAVHRRAAT